MAAFRRGYAAALRSVFLLVVFGTYIGIGALAHDLGFDVGWAMLSTVLVWAAPGQVIVASALASGAAPAAAAIAVSLSAIRLLPMVVALLPQIKGARTPAWQLILPAHFTAISVWVEALRLLPSEPREHRIAFYNGLGVGLLTSALSAAVAGFYLAAGLPTQLAAALLFLTPMSFLFSVARTARLLADRLALVFGLVLGPVLAAGKVEPDLLWTGIIGGTLAYAIDRIRRVMR